MARKRLERGTKSSFGEKRRRFFVIFFSSGGMHVYTPRRKMPGKDDDVPRSCERILRGYSGQKRGDINRTAEHICFFTSRRDR